MTTNEHPWNKLPKNPKFLIIKLRSIGDVIYNTAVYTPLKKRFPDSHLSVLVEPASYDIVKYHHAVDKVLCFNELLINQGERSVHFFGNVLVMSYNHE